MPSLPDWLDARSDAELIDLMSARPDLVVPAPSDLSVLAARLDSAPSVRRAMEGLDSPRLAVLQALVLLDARRHPASRSAVLALLGPGVPAGMLAPAVAELERLALVRAEGELLHLSPGVPAALGPYPAGLGRPGGLTAAQVTERLDGLDPEQLGLLRRLAPGPPVGVIGADSPLQTAADDLVGLGLLTRTAATTVELPREVALALRGPEPLGPVHPEPPMAGRTDHGTDRVDGTAGGAALAALNVIDRLLDLVGQAPPAVLRGGGLGIRDLRRLARTVDLTDHLATMYLEVLFADGLLAGGGSGAERWMPTKEADRAAVAADEVRWARLAATWLDLRRAPGLVGERDPAGRPRNALSPELAGPGAPAERRFVLQALADLPDGTGIDRDALAHLLAWRAPLRLADRRAQVIDVVLAEATALGVVAFDALSGSGRLLLGRDGDGAAAALHARLPTPVRSLMVQADLTVIAPGRLDRALAERLGVAADVESSGSGTVYRVTAASLRRALDGGVTSAELHHLFNTHSVTGVPQALTYLIDDLARQHGTLRAGPATTYVRSEDPTLIDAAIALDAAGRMGLRRLAPTVAISRAPIDEVLELLSGGGLSPAAESPDGELVDLRPAPARSRGGSRIAARRIEPAPPSRDQLAALVARMRAAGLVQVGAPASPTDLLQALRTAANHGQSVWIEYVDSHGTTGRRLVEPIAVSGGAVVAFDRLRNQTRTFALHRVTVVSPGPS